MRVGDGGGGDEAGDGQECVEAFVDGPREAFAFGFPLDVAGGHVYGEEVAGDEVHGGFVVGDVFVGFGRVCGV